MTTIERLKAIADKPSQQLTDADKAFIRTTSAQEGVEFTPKKRCSNCYIDQAVILWKRMHQPTAHNERRWSLLGDRIFWVEGKRYEDATMTDADAEKLMEMGFPKYWFKENADN